MGTAVTGSISTASDVEVPIGTALDADHRPARTGAAQYQRLADDERGTGGKSNADFLGYFAIGLGLAEVLAPHAIAKLIGIKEPDARDRTTMRLMGLREIGSGLAILNNQDPTKAVWARVAGDAIDLALLGKVMSNGENDRGRTLFATANVLAVSALDWITAKQLSKQPETTNTQRADEGIDRMKRSITVNRPVEEIYAFWRNLENLPRFMRHLESVRVTGERTSHWVARAPAGRTVEWDAEIVEDRPNERIAWRSLENADVDNRGSVEFQPAPGGRGTELRVTLEYHPPGGKLGSKLAMFWREEPGQQIHDDLRHFKQVMETGEIVLSDSTKQRGPHPAQPNEKPVQL